MAVNRMIECFSRDLVPVYHHGLESGAVYTASPFCVESLHGHSNRSLPRLSLHIHAEEIIPIFLKWNIYIALCLPKALTLHDSSRTKCSKSWESPEPTNVWEFGEFSALPC